MKKLLTFLTLLTLFFTTAWADTYSFTPTKAADVSFTGASATKSLNGVDWTIAQTSKNTDAYWGYSTNYIQFGSKANTPKTLTLSTNGINGTISSVKVNTYKASAAAATLTVSVGGTPYTNGNNTSYTLTTTKSTVEFSGSSSGEIVIFFNQTATTTNNSTAIYFGTIEITYTTGSGPLPAVTPTFTPDGGTFYEPQTVTISSTTEGATIYYTKDGSDPDPASSESIANNGTVTIDATCTLTAIATATGYDPSNSYSKLFTINTPQTVEVPQTYNESLINGFGKFYFVDKVNATTTDIWKTNSYGAVATGYFSSSNHEAESWLYSPYIDLTNASNPKLSFEQAINSYFGTVSEEATVWVKETNANNWTKLTITYPDKPSSGYSDYLSQTIDLSAYANKTIQVAFKYTSTATTGGTWRVRNFKVENAGTFEIFRHYKTLGADNNNAEGWMGYWGGGATTPNGSDYADYTVQAESGSTVTFLIGHNNNNYQLLPSNVSVVDANGNPVENLVISDVNTYGQTPVSFTMPASNVDITANFTYYRPTVRLAGHFNGRTGSNWVNDAAGPQFTYDETNDEYTIDAYFVGADDNGARDYFFLFLDNEAKHPSSGNYPITSVDGTEMTFGLGGGDSNNFSIEPGVYNIKINGSFNKMYVTKIQDPTISFSHAAGEVPSGTVITATSTLTDIIEAIQDNDDYALGEVTVQVRTDGSSFSNSVTLTDDATVTAKASIGNIEYTETAEYTVVEIQGDVYTLVEGSSDLNPGDEYLIVSTEYKAILGPKASGGNYAQAIYDNFVYNATAKTITLLDGCAATPLILGGNTTDGWTFQVSENTYLAYTGQATSSSNYLYFVGLNSNGVYWDIDVNKLPSDKLLIHNKYNDVRYIMYNNPNTRFASYVGTSTSTDLYAVSLFKKVSSTPSNKSEAPVITPTETTVVGGLVNVTITAADGAAIYYTTTVGQTGTTPDVEDDDQLYTDVFELTHTGGYKTVTAIAVEAGKEPSDPVSKTYLFTSPEAPSFNPDPSEIQSGDFTITINTNPDYVGAAIYYMLDPATVPNGANDVKDNGNVYDAATGVLVTGHGQHTIYAIVELNDMKSSVATATYTIFSEGDVGDWKLVESLEDIQDGRKYVIVNSDFDRAVSDKETSRFYSVPCENNVLFGPGRATVTVAGEDVHVFFIEIEENNIYLKDADNYYNLTSDVSTGKQPVYISMDNGFVYIKGSSESNRSLAYNTGYGNYFGMYASPTPNGSQRPIYMYYYDGEPVEEPTEATLAEIITLGENADGKLYKISNEDGLLGVYSQGTSVWFKDEYPEVAVDYQDPTGYEYYTVVEDALEINKSEKDFDQSNWIEVVFQDNANYNNKYVRNLTGTYSWQNGNPKLTLTVDVDETNDVTDVPVGALAYELNPYMAANFVGNQEYTNSQGVTSTYFFSNPKAQEYAQILWAVWDGSKFNMPTTNNAYGFTGSFTVNDELNGGVSLDGLQSGKTYNFKAIIRKSASKAGPYEVYPTDLNPGVVTGVGMINVNGNVKSVKYVNVAGIVSDVPFQGVNIVVTEYTDGSRTTTKMLKK